MKELRNAAAGHTRNIMNYVFDTHKFIKHIKSAGFDEKQAEAIVETIAESREYDFSKLATKEQFELVDQKIEFVKQQMQEMKQQMATKEDLHKLEAGLLKWLIPFIFSVLGILITVVFKLFSH